MTGLYRMEIDFGRMGELESIFISDDSSIKKLIGRKCYFGECLGKHSEITVTIKEEYLTLLTQDETVVDIVRKYGLSTGLDPFDYIRCVCGEYLYDVEEELCEYCKKDLEEE